MCRLDAVLLSKASACFQGCCNGCSVMLIMTLLIFQGSCLLLTQAGCNKSPGDLERAARWVTMWRVSLWVPEGKASSGGASLLSRGPCRAVRWSHRALAPRAGGPGRREKTPRALSPSPASPAGGHTSPHSLSPLFFPSNLSALALVSAARITSSNAVLSGCPTARRRLLCSLFLVRNSRAWAPV